MTGVHRVACIGGCWARGGAGGPGLSVPYGGRPEKRRSHDPRALIRNRFPLHMLYFQKPGAGEAEMAENIRAP